MGKKFQMMKSKNFEKFENINFDDIYESLRFCSVDKDFIHNVDGVIYYDKLATAYFIASTEIIPLKTAVEIVSYLVDCEVIKCVDSILEK